MLREQRFLATLASYCEIRPVLLLPVLNKQENRDGESNRKLRIPDDADQRSGLMPITHSERCRSVIPGDADHSFWGDPDRFD